MCSIGDDNSEDLGALKYMPSVEMLSLSGTCNKCKEQEPCIVLRGKDKYCKSCFLNGVNHKYKALLGKYKLIKPKDRVLVVHRCGHASTTLLHLIRTGLNLDTHKKLRFDATVLFIENHLHLSLKERLGLLKKVQFEADKNQFLIYYTTIRDILLNNIKITNNFTDLELKENDTDVINSIIKDQKNKTTKNDFLEVTTRNAILKIAEELICQFIFTPEISNDVSAQFLTNISLGRGSHTYLDSGFCDDRHENIKILRPMRLFDCKELVYYNYYNNLEPVTFHEKTTNIYESVQSLMKKFINDLQVNYPATVTTVLKTSDKLSLNSEPDLKCQFCNGPINKQGSNLSSAESTQFSHWVSIKSSDHNQTRQERYKSVSESFKQQLLNKYCFGCSNLFK